MRISGLFRVSTVHTHTICVAMILFSRNNRKGGTASLRSRTCVKRNAVFGARFKGLSLYFLYLVDVSFPAWGRGRGSPGRPRELGFFFIENARRMGGGGARMGRGGGARRLGGCCRKCFWAGGAYFFFVRGQNSHLVYIKKESDTYQNGLGYIYLIRIQTRTPPVTAPHPFFDYSKEYSGAKKDSQSQKSHKQLLSTKEFSEHFCGHFGNGPHTVSESTVSNTELSEFFGPHRVPGRELSEFLSAYFLVCQSELTEFFAELAEFAVRLSEFSSPKQYSRNSILPVC